MDRRVLSFVLLTLAGVVGACGGDDGGDSKSGSAGSVAPTTEKTVCSGETCALPENVDGKLCCTTPFNGKCGVETGNGATCMPFPENVDERCPVPLGMSGMVAGGGFVYGCCADNGECGLGFASMPCQPVSALCNLVPKQFVMNIQAQTCEGEMIELPADCGVDFMFPARGGAGGTGTATGSGGMSGADGD